MTEPVFPVRVHSITWEATDVLSFRLKALDGSPLPRFEPGSHIDVQLPNGLMRSYSLSDLAEGEGYRLTVARDPNSTGGSAYLADRLRVGTTIEISAPRNNFAVALEAERSVFIAGGIGITPFVPMAARLNALKRRWRLHYCVRTRDRAALLGELQALADAGFGEIVMNIDQEPGGTMLDVAQVVAALGVRDHVYCCGPAGMLDAFRQSCSEAGLADERVHFEYFKGAVTAAADGGFDVVLARSGKTVRVQPGETILDALLTAGLDMAYSCREGVCGSCELTVLAGEPDHRDLILSDTERAANRTMMVCCSGSKGASLTLDV